MINTIEVKCDLETLLDVLNATGNATVAIQMLNGTYERPWIQEEKIGRWDTKKEKVTVDGVEEEIETKTPVIFTMVSYCPFSNKVTYVKDDGWKRSDDCTLEYWQGLESPYQLAV